MLGEEFALCILQPHSLHYTVNYAQEGSHAVNFTIAFARSVRYGSGEMAKTGEGDSRWIVSERGEEGRNVNNCALLHACQCNARGRRARCA